jgi:hypothetical protein
MNHRKKLSSQQQTDEQQQAVSQHETQKQAQQEFGSVEELLRHDALHTPVPPSVARRLEESISQLPSPQPRSWWRKLLGR